MTSTLRAAACALALLASGCGLLDVSDPTQLEEGEVANATSALMMRTQALHQLYLSFSLPALYGGLLTDELLADPAISISTGVTGYEVADRRWSQGYDETFVAPYGELAAARWRAADAIRQLRAYAPAAVKEAYIGQMFAARGLVEVIMAETFCPGFPLNEVVNNQVVAGAPLSTAQVFEHALAELDSAIAHSADSTRILNLARVARARALLGLGRFGDAAAAVAEVPTSYMGTTEFSSTQFTGATNALYAAGTPQWSPADQEGGIGLNFVSASDPRIGLVSAGKGRDGVLNMYRMAKYPSNTAPVVMASGIEARLIEAEAALAASNPSWLTILNDLRATQVNPAMSTLSDPGTPDARVDLLFRERAFWLFATGHRLGDLRRLVAHYSRAPEAVFPAGNYRLGGTYEAATSLPFPFEAEASRNPAITGCTSR